jgi:hypothetical protein
MSVILRLSDLKIRVHEALLLLLLCMQSMGRKLMSAVLFFVKFLKVNKLQYTGVVFLVKARCFALVNHGHLL